MAYTSMSDSSLGSPLAWLPASTTAFAPSATSWVATAVARSAISGSVTPSPRPLKTPARQRLTIRLEPQIGEERLRELSMSPAAHALGWRFERPSRLGRHAARLALHGCDLLAADADWDAPTWSMRPAETDRLADSTASLLAPSGSHSRRRGALGRRERRRRSTRQPHLVRGAGQAE